jgi:hypothetical protein
MIGTSGRATAAALGVSETALRKAKISGRINALSDGSYDIESVREQWSATTDPVRTRVRTCEPVRTPVRTEEDAREAVSMVRRILDEEGVQAGTVDFNATRTADLILKARERAIRIEVAQGRLIDAEAARKMVFELSRQDRDSWTNWPARMAPLMAAQFGIDQMKLTIYLDDAVRQHLAERSDPELRFKKSA